MKAPRREGDSEKSFRAGSTSHNIPVFFQHHSLIASPSNLAAEWDRQKCF